VWWHTLHLQLRLSATGMSSSTAPHCNNSTRSCPRCGVECVIITCRNGGENHGRQLYKCPQKCGKDAWIGWVDGGVPRKPANSQRRNGNIGTSGQSFDVLREQEKANSMAETITARKRKESGEKGAFVTFDHRKQVRGFVGGRASGVASVGASALQGLCAEKRAQRKNTAVTAADLLAATSENEATCQSSINSFDKQRSTRVITPKSASSSAEAASTSLTAEGLRAARLARFNAM